ncbi:RidA family protein [Jannaschia sp. CCS1]|uniref:RidA family protein n=1 Tax=Jannaschia sp. (strain CCS1) TaxID=290400 RepID=UPI000053B19A|nr:RidA family protein [Jannaschia sp. CCS1]ABD54571.1 Endoribonuclease L-PSP [Jannaschia sp. CCS1]
MTIDRHPDGLIGKCSAAVHGGLAYIVANAPEPGEGILDQTSGCLAELDRLLRSVGSDRTRVLQVTVYLSDIADKPRMDSIWMPWIGAEENWPQRACVGADLDPGYLIEIVATAVVGSD